MDSFAIEADKMCREMIFNSALLEIPALANRTLTIRYEDLQAKFKTTFTTMMTFLGHTVTDTLYREAMQVKSIMHANIPVVRTSAPSIDLFRRVVGDTPSCAEVMGILSEQRS